MVGFLCSGVFGKDRDLLRQLGVAGLLGKAPKSIILTWTPLLHRAGSSLIRMASLGAIRV